MATIRWPASNSRTRSTSRYLTWSLRHARTSQTMAEAQPASIHALAWTRRPRPRAAGAPGTGRGTGSSAAAVTSMSVGWIPATRPIPSAFKRGLLDREPARELLRRGGRLLLGGGEDLVAELPGIADQHPLEPLRASTRSQPTRVPEAGALTGASPGNAAVGGGPPHCSPRRLRALTRPPSARGRRATRRGRDRRGTSPCGRDRDAPAPSEFPPGTRGRSTPRAAAAAGAGAAG